LQIKIEGLLFKQQQSKIEILERYPACRKEVPGTVLANLETLTGEKLGKLASLGI